ncbi:hypothetical protein ACWEOO_14890 [Kribbella sp. NPDC004138]
MDESAKAELLLHLETWSDQDEPLVEAIGDTLARWQRADSQEQARRVVSTLIDVFERDL